jgi:hypothetical protein
MSESNEISAAALEASLPRFTRKLEELKNGLSPDEQAVLSSIVNSAALHLKAMQPISDSANIRYETPIVVSVRANGDIGVRRGDRNPNDQASFASGPVREHLINLPETLGLTEVS